MSFKDKAREIRDHGAEKRGTYSPEADSAPLRMYARWAKIRPKKVRDRENFCHYWRVVLFWAPLWVVLSAIGRGLERAIDALGDFGDNHPRWGIFAVAGMALVLLTALTLGGSGAWLGALTVLLILYLIASAFFGLYALIEYDLANLEKMRRDDFIDAVFIFFPSMLVIAVFKVPYLVGSYINRKVPSSVWPVVGKGIAGALGVAAVAAVVWAFITWPGYGVLAICGIVVAAVVIFGLSIASDIISLRYKDAKAKRTRWETEVVDYGDFQYEKEVKVVEPGRIAKFFMAIGDFINVGIQAVRVNKWKICPIVEIPEVNNESA